MISKCSIMIMSNNHQEMLKECLEKVRATIPDDWEIIVVDDASDIPYTKEEFGDVIIVRMPRRSNCCNLRNVGMEMAKTEFVFWLDNDTMVNNDWWQPLLEKMESSPLIGIVGQPKDSRLIRNPFLPLTQEDCMVEYQFAYDFNHLNGECDFITSYCILVRKSAFRPTYCYNMPTPCLDPELGAMVKAQGYKVVVADKDINVVHAGSATERLGGRNYHYYLSRNFTRWWNFWKGQKEKVFELYSGKPVKYDFDANESGRKGSMGQHGDKDKEFDVIPKEYEYVEP